MNKNVDIKFMEVYNKIEVQLRNMNKQSVKEYILDIKRDNTIDIRLKNNLLKIYLFLYKKIFK